MKSLKGTQTERNILTAFAGESQARNRYDYFAGAAKKDGFVPLPQLRLSGDRYARPGPVPRLCAPHRSLRSAPQPVVSR